MPYIRITHSIGAHLDKTPSEELLLQLVGKHIYSKWNAFGVYLGIKHNVRQGVHKQKIGDPMECFILLCAKWLSGDEGTGYKPRTWRTVFDAVRECEYPDIAVEAEKNLVHTVSGWGIYNLCIHTCIANIIVCTILPCTSRLKYFEMCMHVFRFAYLHLHIIFSHLETEVAVYCLKKYQDSLSELPLYEKRQSLCDHFLISKKCVKWAESWKKSYTQTEINSMIIMDILGSVRKDFSHFDIFCEFLHCHYKEMAKDTLKKIKGMYVFDTSVIILCVRSILEV